MKKTVWGWIAAGVAATVAVVAVVYEETKKPPSSPMPGPTSQQLTPGHRYGLTLTCPMALPLPSPPIPDAAVLNLLGIPNIAIVPGSFAVASGGKGFSVAFDYTGPAMALPAIQASGATACTTQLVDQGTTPISVQHPNQLQVVSLVAGQNAYNAQAKASTLLVKPPSGAIVGHITSITPSSGVGSVSGNSVALTGTPGTIAVAWSSTNIATFPPSTNSYTATITVA